jgi:uncharacterized NAD-dependent epimerase/dehydratase family protein
VSSTDRNNAMAAPHAAPPRHLILADGDFGPMTSKTANSIIRYQAERVVAVLDRKNAGKTAQDVLGFGGAIPVVASMAEGLTLGANSVLVGIAPAGGRLPEEWREWLREALVGGCNIVSGLHTFLGDDPVLAETAAKHGRTLTDIRRPPTNLPIASGLARDLAPLVLLTVGTDCNVGKMTAQLQLVQGLKKRGLRTNFVATGQTGIMIEGWGIGVDAVVADFIAGAAEQITVKGAENADVVLVEGQGSINHPGYSGVTVGLLHGSCPDAMILCHQATREYIGDYRQASWLALPPLSEYVKAYESLAGMVSPSKVIGIALNTYDMTDDEAREACRQASEETGLPATDPVRFDPAPLLDAIVKAHKEHVDS